MTINNEQLTVSYINKSRFQDEVDFGVTMLLVREMLTAKIITQLEFTKIEKMYKAKYKPVFQGFSIR